MFKIFFKNLSVFSTHKSDTPTLYLNILSCLFFIIFYVLVVYYLLFIQFLLIDFLFVIDFQLIIFTPTNLIHYRNLSKTESYAKE